MQSKPIIYQLFVRLFGNKKTNPVEFGSIERNGCGKFDDITDKALQGIKELGTSHIWLTGILEHASLNAYPELGIEKDNNWIVKGIAGSPYAVRDYFDVDADLANKPAKRMQEFEALMKRMRKAKLGIIIDFIANHVSRTYHSDVLPEGCKNLGHSDNSDRFFLPSNNYYYLPGDTFSIPEGIMLPPTYETFPLYYEYPAKATGNDCFSSHPHVHDWYETVKLNFGVNYQTGEKHFEPIPDTWFRMLEVLQFWARKGVYGFRCDMVELVPVEFWAWVIAKIKTEYPTVIFIAEVYNPSLYHAFINFAGFDYLYDKVGMYDTLRELLEEKGNANHITNIWKAQEGMDSKMLRFLENHDEHRIASPFFANKAEKAVPAMAVVALMGKGPMMIYNGQEVGEEASGTEGFSGDDGKTTIFDYWNMPSLQNWMNKGAFDGALLSPEQNQLLAFYRKLGKLLRIDPVWTNGHFFDLQYANQGNSFGYNSERMFSFLRYAENEIRLVVCNFEATPKQLFRVKIPTSAWASMQMPLSGQYQIIDLIGMQPVFRFYAEGVHDITNTHAGIALSLPGWSAGIYKIESVK